jgi:vancomycin aglycone glucosyltransferase
VRVALVADGTRGDVHPLLELGVRLRGAGHEALLVSTPDFAEDAAARGVPFRAVGPSSREYLTAHADIMGRGGVRFVIESGRYFRTILRAQRDELPEALAGSDLVVAASLAVMASSAAEKLGVPYRFVLYCPLLLPSAEHPFVAVTTQSLPPWLNRLSWRALLPPIDRLFVTRQVNEARRVLGLAPVRSAYRHFLGERTLLAADRALAPAPGDAAPTVLQVPALQPPAEPLPAKLEGFLAGGPPPVYVGFGSMTDEDAAATTRTLVAAIERLGCRALIGSGWAALGDGPLPAGVLTIGPVSHAALFPRCAAVVHHGGAGTTTTAARAGVPQVVVPHLADQHYWAERVRRLGLGPPPLRRRRLTPARLADALSAVLDNEILAERARDLGRGLRTEADRTDWVSEIIR